MMPISGFFIPIMKMILALLKIANGTNFVFPKMVNFIP